MQGFQRVFGWAVWPLAVGVSGCGAFQYGAQNAHFSLAPNVEFLTAMQFDMLAKPLRAMKCAAPGTAYSVTVLGTTRPLSRGEQAAALEALQSTAGTADVLLVSRSVGSVNEKGESCGKIWGRGLKLRARDFDGK
jgi:multidrug efflux pump subunit AcrA (membrane-fusion protein)